MNLHKVKKINRCGPWCRDDGPKARIENKCSDRSMSVKLSAPSREIMTDRPSDQPTNQQLTDHSHREVTLPKDFMRRRRRKVRWKGGGDSRRSSASIYILTKKRDLPSSFSFVYSCKFCNFRRERKRDLRARNTRLC